MGTRHPKQSRKRPLSTTAERYELLLKNFANKRMRTGCDMKSIDTNILLYAVNRECLEHTQALQLVRTALQEPHQWIIADQVWFELYRLLRNPAVLSKPLSAEKATHTIQWYRQQSGWLSCAWEPDMMNLLLPYWEAESFPARNSFDLVLAITLAQHGVDLLYTRTTRDFESLNLFKLQNPL